MDAYEDLVLLISAREKLNLAHQVFIGLEVLIVVYVLIYIIILVFSPNTYGLNSAGKWMARVALIALVTLSTMSYFGKKLKEDIRKKKEMIGSEDKIAALRATRTSQGGLW